MNLPSVEFLKDQAYRLVAHLSEKHGIKLKTSGALEAVAAIYKQRDWNTAHALAQRETAGVVERARSATLSHFTPPGRYPLTWRDDQPDWLVDANDWYRHTLVSGGSTADRQGWLQQQLMAQLDRNGGGLFWNAFGGALPAAVRKGIKDRALMVDLGQPLQADGLALNLLADMAPDEVASCLIHCLLPNVSNPGTDYYRQTANYALTVTVAALHASGQPITLRRLVALFGFESPTALEALCHQLPLEAPERCQLEELLTSMRGAAGSSRPLASVLGGMTGRMAQLSYAPWAPLLFADDPSAPSLQAMLNQGQCIVLEPERNDVALPGKFILFALRSALSASYASSHKPAWVVGLGDLPEYLTESQAHMANHARICRVALLMTTPDRASLRQSPAGQSVLDHSWNQMSFGGLDTTALAELQVELGQTSMVLRQPGSLRMTHCSRPQVAA